MLQKLAVWSCWALHQTLLINGCCLDLWSLVTNPQLLLCLIAMRRVIHADFRKCGLLSASVRILCSLDLNNVISNLFSKSIRVLVGQFSNTWHTAFLMSGLVSQSGLSFNLTGVDTRLLNINVQRNFKVKLFGHIKSIECRVMSPTFTRCRHLT